MTNIDMVTVVNNHEMYNNYFINNPNVNKNNLVMYDNTVDNIPVTKRFNDYIKNKMTDDNWIVFCHQDFEIHEDLQPKLENLDKNCIYGPIGAGLKNHFVFFLRLNGLKIMKSRFGFVKVDTIKGQIHEQKDQTPELIGSKTKELSEVNTLDCCCFILHSSLIKGMDYQFDENLDWHLYAEDICIYSNKKYKVKTRIINFKATHYSGGNINEDFYKSVEYLKNKYNEPFVTTCYNGLYREFTNGL